MKRAPLVILVLCLGAVAGLLCSCGKKTPPHLPRTAFDKRVTDLEGRWEEGAFALAGRIERPGGRGGLEEIRGCRVYFGVYPSDDPPCAECPIAYQGFHGFGPEVISGERFSCRFRGALEGRVVFIKVYLLGPEGVLGPPSERIRLAP